MIESFANMLRFLKINSLVFASALFVLSCQHDSNVDTASSLVATVTSTEAAIVPSEETAGSGSNRQDDLAPEFVGISSWINSDPLTMDELRGKVVLIDFWTYTCINCLRTLPFLRDWYDKYSANGLVIIGVHSPEFEFEKIRQNVIDATVVEGVKWPVAQDNYFETWDAYRNNFWPAKYLIDKDGYIRYKHFGEGAYDETEEQIRKLLVDVDPSVSTGTIKDYKKSIIDSRAHGENPAIRMTRELYAGFERNYMQLLRGYQPPYVAHQEYFDGPNRDIEYQDPDEYINQFIYLKGLWRNELESLSHARETENYEDHIGIKFYGTSVNVVIGLNGGKPYDVRVMLDDRPLRPSEAGVDVVFDNQGNSFILVSEARMYRVIDISEFGGHRLNLSSNSSHFSVFAYTFGAFTK